MRYNDVIIKVEEGHNVGRRLMVIDPHKTKSDSLYNSIRTYEGDFLLPVASTQEEIIHAIAIFKEEALRRIAGGSYVEGWTIIVDEVAALCGSPGLRSEEQDEMYRLIAPLAKMCGQQLRGYEMSEWFISQSPIGLSWLTDAAMTIFVHKLLRENQQKLATNNNRIIMDDMPSWPRGRVFCYRLDIQGEYLLQQPRFTPLKAAQQTRYLEDLRPNPFTRKLESGNAVSGPETALQADASESVNTFTFPDAEKLDAEKSLDTSIVGSDKRAIIRKLAERMPLRDVAEIVSLGGRHYKLFQSVCAEEGIRKGA